MEKRQSLSYVIKAYQANCDRIQEIADVCERENRERNEAEDREYKDLCRQNSMLEMKASAMAADHLRENPNTNEAAENLLRENMKAGRKTQLIMVRDAMMVSDLQNGAVIPLNVQQMLKPLEEGFILEKVGLPMPTGLVGDFVWPTYETVEAQILGEAVALTDKKINLGKLTAAPERIGLTLPITNQSLTQSDGVLEMLIREIFPAAVRQLLNKLLFMPGKIATATRLFGPFALILNNALDSEAAANGSINELVPLANVPTFKQLNAEMKAKVLETGIDGEHLCWVMTKSMKAILEGTPINSSGIYVPICQNDKICGLPVYTTNAIRSVTKVGKKYASGSWGDYTISSSDTVKYHVDGYTAAAALAKISGTPAANDIAELTIYTEYIGLGDWRYQPMGLFGGMRFIVDPYTGAPTDTVRFTLNCDYATKTIRPEAFILGRVTHS